MLTVRFLWGQEQPFSLLPHRAVSVTQARQAICEMAAVAEVELAALAACLLDQPEEVQ